LSSHEFQDLYSFQHALDLLEKESRVEEGTVKEGRSREQVMGVWMEGRGQEQQKRDRGGRYTERVKEMRRE